MNNIPKIDLKSLSTRIRPPRYAVLVDINSKDWIKDFNTVIEWFSLHWGGLNNIIIPTDNNKIDDIFWSVLEVFKPDFCIQYFSGQRINLSTKLSNDLENELYKRLNIFPYNNKTMAIPLCHSSNLHTLNTNILTILKDKGGFDFKLYDFNFKYNKNTELILRSRFGTFEKISKLIEVYNRGLYSYFDISNRINKISFQLNYFDNDATNEIQAFRKYSRIIGDTTLNTIYSLTNYGLRKFISNNKNSNDDTYYFILGSSIKDFYLFNSIEKMTDKAFWIGEESNINVEIKFLTELLFQIEHDILLADTSINCRVLSLSIDQEKLKKLWRKVKVKFSGNENLKLLFVNSEVHSGMVKIINDINPIRFFEGDLTNEYYADHFYNNNSLNPLRVPVPISFKKINTREYKWIVDFEILSNTNALLKDGYTLPPMNIFNIDVFSEINHFMSKLVRFTGEGISFLCPNLGPILENMREHIIKPRIRILEDEEIFKRLFNYVNVDYKISDKGNYEHHSTNLFGSFENIYDDFKNGNLVNLFEKFSDNKDFGNERLQKEKKGICLKNVKRVYYNYNELKEIIQNDELTRVSLEKYLNNGVLKRGLILKCKFCNNCNWYDIKILEQRFICSRCQNEQLISKENWLKIENGVHSDEPTFYYSLNEIIYQGYSSCMRYPILTKGYLKNLTKQSFISIPEIEIKYKNAKPDEKGNELDLICISDGEILIGEVKKKAKISGNIGIYNDVCNKLNARFVLSTYAENWEREAIVIIDTKKWVKEPLILTRKELLA